MKTKTNTLLWTDAFPSINIRATRKKFFNQYIYKARIYVPFGALIARMPDGNMQRKLDSRINHVHEMISANWLAHTTKTRLLGWVSHSRVAPLEYLSDLKKAKKDGIKFRIEEPYVNLFTNDIDDLYDIIKAGPALDVRELFVPESDTAEESLNKGEIIVRKETEYKFKVFFCISASHKKSNILQNVYAYLTNLGDDVMMSKGCRDLLTGERRYVSQSYFYIKDESLALFLNMMAPKLITGIYKLTKITDKY